MKFHYDRLGSIVDASSGTAMTAVELTKEIRARSEAYGKLKFGPGDVVVVRHGNSPDFFADLFAVWERGACAAVLNPQITSSELERVSEFLHPVAHLTVEGPENVVEQRRENLPNNAEIDRNALILLTSGTTGQPKAVVHTFRSLWSRIVLNHSHIADPDISAALCPLPTHFGHGLIGNGLTPLFGGANLVLASGNDVRLVSQLGEIIDEFNIEFMSSVPAFWRLATRVSKQPTKDTLRRIHVGSAPLSANLWRSIMDWTATTRVVNMYGITETANWLAGADASEVEPEDGLIGRMWGGAVAVRNKSGELCGSGEGELAVLSPSLMAGYFRRQDLTEEAFRDGWYHTGDIGTVSKSGEIRLTGRIKLEINRAGIKVHPEDIDVLLESHDSVRETCAFAIPDEIAGELVGVAVVMDDTRPIILDDLRSWCAERMVTEKRPDRWFILDDIPKSPNGKVDRGRVTKICLERNGT